MSPVDFDEGWGKMQKGINKLKRILEGLEDHINSEEYMLLYTTVYNMCTQKGQQDCSQQKLYDNFRVSVEEYITSMVLPVLRKKQGEFRLRELVRRWANHKLFVRWLHRFFHYLDRFFITRRSLECLQDVGHNCFLNLAYKELQTDVRETVIALINKEREGEYIDKSFLKSVVDIFVEMGKGNMGCYENDFEVQLLENTADYYKSKAAEWIEVDSCSDYMLKAEDRMRKERERVSHYLHSSTEQKLVEKVEHELLITHVNRLLEMEYSGCHVMLRDDKVEDLSRMFRLYSKVPKGLDHVASAFKQHITNEGTALVRQAEEAAKNQTTSGSGAQEQVLIRKFIELHNNYMKYVNDCFMNHLQFHKALKEAFEVFCNKTVAGCPIAELLASFCDNTLKKNGSEKLNDAAVEQTLEMVVKLLVYISEKDLFAEFYRKKLGRRMLFGLSGNNDHEMSILTQLKQQFGGQFTSKMEGMVTDFTVTKDTQQRFEGHLRYYPNKRPGVELSVTVLTTGFWPTYKSCNLTLPSEMAKCVEVFKSYYNEEYKEKRKLSWIFSLGTCAINGKFEQKTIELVVSTFQAAVLLLFNTTDRLSYSEIMTQLNLNHDDVVRTLHSLSCAKYKILNKEPNTKMISRNDSFEFNSKFTDKARRIRVPLPPLDERKKIIEDVDKDRRYAIDAALVRIMKSRKVLGYQQLVLECIEMLSPMFKPDIKVIKKRIENLIGQEYLERDQHNSNTFKYLA